MSGDYEVISQDMLAGIKLCLNHVNNNGGINGQKVVLDVYDDKGDRNTAVKVAMEIAKKNRALLVLGHYFSSTSLSAGKVYLKEGIPAITGSATSENITNKNEWYFSVVPNNKFQGEFIANYIYTTLGYKSCRVIYDTDEYGQSLFNSFESKATILGLDIKKTWHFDTKASNGKYQLNKIISELRTIPDPGMVFLATHAKEGARLVTSMKYPGSKYQIIGADALSTNSFINELKKNPQEKTRPGYYSDNIFTISPFLSDFTNENNLHFISDYFKKYQKKPNWVSACYYDATLMALKSMQNIDGSEKIRDARMIIRKRLESHYNLESSVKGVCGPLFFDRHRSVTFPLKVTSIKNQTQVPFYLQYYIQEHPMNDERAFEKILNNQLKTSGNIVMNETRIVFTGIHVNEVKSVDIYNGQYEMDFFIWFRFQGEFDDKNIVFLNAINPVQLNQVFAEFKNGKIVTRVYHLNEKFNSDFDFTNCPFEKHELSIQFRHFNKNLKNYTYIPDHVNESFVNEQLSINKQKAIRMPSEWKICDTFFYNGIISYESSFGIPIEFHLKRPVVYSTGNAVVKIKRSNNKYALKLLAPGVLLFLLLVVVCFTPYKFNSFFLYSLISIMIVSGLFLIESYLFFELQYLTFAQNIYLSLFTGTCFGILFCLLTLYYATFKKQNIKVIIFSRAFIFIIVFGLLYHFYLSLFNTTDMNRRIIHVYSNSQQTNTGNSSDMISNTNTE